MTEERIKKEGMEGKIEVYYFHLISWIAFPFLGFAGGKAF